jgi:hypothetical protein
MKRLGSLPIALAVTTPRGRPGRPGVPPVAWRGTCSYPRDWGRVEPGAPPMPARIRLAALALVAALGGAPAAGQAEVSVPPGFSVHSYVTGEGFDLGSGRGGRGIPAVSTLAVDQAGSLFLARTGRRYLSGEGDDLRPLYRIPPGGAALRPETEARYFHGPPLPSPQVAGIRGGHEVLVTTFDRERRIGVLYGMVDGRARLLAGGTPPRGTPPLLRQPEGVAVDPAGAVYVADRAEGIVVRLDAAGRVLDPRWLVVRRPRTLAANDQGRLWIGADADAEAPWQAGPGEIWRVGPEGPRLVLRGPMAAGLALGPGGLLFVAERAAATVFLLTPEGGRVDFAAFTANDAPRGLAFAPDTPATRRAGIAGDLFVVVIRQGAWPVNEVVRISGPFDELTRRRPAATP